MFYSVPPPPPPHTQADVIYSVFPLTQADVIYSVYSPHTGRRYLQCFFSLTQEYPQVPAVLGAVKTCQTETISHVKPVIVSITYHH